MSTQIKPQQQIICGKVYVPRTPPCTVVCFIQCFDFGWATEASGSFSLQKKTIRKRPVHSGLTWSSFRKLLPGKPVKSKANSSSSIWYRVCSVLCQVPYLPTAFAKKVINSVVCFVFTLTFEQPEFDLDFRMCVGHDHSPRIENQRRRSRAIGLGLGLAQMVKRSSIEGSFYRAMLCIPGTSHGPVSVCHKPGFY